jgi:hypothetical protein
MTRQWALAAFFLCLTSGAWGQDADALPDAAHYPAPNCIKPQIDLVSPKMTINTKVGAGAEYDSGNIGSYNSKIKAFNKAAAAYDSCMHAYIDKANGDVKRIQEYANTELKRITDQANGAMKAIQDKIRQAVSDANGVATALDEQAAKIRRR